MTKPFKIGELFAWIVVHADGEDGIPAVQQGDRVLPLMGSERAKIYSFKESVIAILAPGMRAEFRQFHRMQVLEKIDGPTEGRA